MSDYRAIAADVAVKADAGVCGVVVNASDGKYYIWAIGVDGKIKSHELDAANTSPERLMAHVSGFIDNHLAAFGERKAVA